MTVNESSDQSDIFKCLVWAEQQSSKIFSLLLRVRKSSREKLETANILALKMTKTIIRLSKIADN